MSKRSQIHQEIESLSQKLQSTNQVLAGSDELSMLDIDLLRKTTIEIYDLVNNLRLVMHEKASRNLEAELEAAKALAAEAEAKAKAEVEAAKVLAAEAEAKFEAEVKAKAEQEAREKAEGEAKDKVEVEEAPVMEDAVPVEEPAIEELVVVEEPVVEETIVETETLVEEPVAEAEPIEEEIIPTEEPVVETAAPKNTPIFEEEPTDLAGKFSATPIADIKQSISIAKKFEYINTLFQGNVEKYSRSIVNLNSMRNGDEAFDELNRLRRELGWEEEDANYLELANLIRRRYLG